MTIVSLSMLLSAGKDNEKECTVRKVSKYGVFSGSYFPAFGLNTERYEISLCIQSECGKIRTRKSSVFGHISHSGNQELLSFHLLFSIISLKSNSFTFNWKKCHLQKHI